MIISIYKTYNSSEADLVQAQLESEGICCFLKSDNAGGALSYLTSTHGIEIMIHSNDQALALSVLKSYLKRPKTEKTMLQPQTS